MSRTLTALYDTRADAEAAQARLHAMNVGADHVRLHDQSSSGYSETASRTTAKPDQGIWASIKNAFLPDEDRSVYEEGVRRGGTLLTADVGEDRVDEVIRVLEDSNSVDVDTRQDDWRGSGWTGNAVGAAAGMATPAYGTGYADETGASSGLDRGMTSARETGTGEMAIPIVQEQLRVGKREVERGGVRVRSYTVETPVSEQVRLREEHVSVERRPVDLPLSAADGDAFRERSIELTETDEIAVVGKEARVVEEVLVRKDVGERVETVQDSVRRTEVEVEHTGAEEELRMAAGRQPGTFQG